MTISPDLQTKYFVQVNGKEWTDVPQERFERWCGAGFPGNPFDSIDHAQLAVDTLYMFGDEHQEFRVVARPVSTKE